MSPDYRALAQSIKQWGLALGFQHIGITDTDLTDAENHLLRWLAAGRHGTMGYMVHHGSRRSRPAELVPDTIRVICARLDYLPQGQSDCEAILADPDKAYVSRYALGRDYHKIVRQRLQRLADRVQDAIGPFGYRVFSDSAPVLEKALAEKAGIGWIGKHTNVLSRDAGSWYFLGEIYTDLPLTVDSTAANHCGTCQACIDICPTRAIVAPYELDARRCISYLTIEHAGAIPVNLRPLLGNRIYGCDDCQLVCPWNRFASLATEPDFAPRHQLDSSTLVELFGWNADTFLKKTEGSAIRRIGHERWLRNIAVALGNAPPSETTQRALLARRDESSELVQEHVQWALEQQEVDI